MNRGESAAGMQTSVLWYDGESQAAADALDRLKGAYDQCIDLGDRSVPECCELALAQDSVSVVVTSIRSAWLALRLVVLVGSSSGVILVARRLGR
jgi:hypothetical protein